MVDQKGFTYRIHRKFEDGKAHWRCNAGKLAFKCYARAVTMGNKITKFSGVHSHPPDFQPDYQALFASIP